MSGIIIDPEDVNLKCVKTNIKVTKSKTPKQLSKKHINIPIPESLKSNNNKIPTVSLINISNEGELINIGDDLKIPDVKIENIENNVPFYQRKELQIIGGVIALGAVGYLIYRYWPSSVEVVKDVVENSVKDSVSSTL
ncbi:hypothetical protein ACTFIY_004582 [Dictyostelium cf. discoideum]